LAPRAAGARGSFQGSAKEQLTQNQKQRHAQYDWTASSIHAIPSILSMALQQAMQALSDEHVEINYEMNTAGDIRTL
jgi:hypothetical protein